RMGFSQRRKQLRNLLPEPPGGWAALCEEAGIAEAARAEDLTLAQWEELAARFHPPSAQKDSELFDVVDENDRVLGPQPRGFVHVNNLRHRAVHI
ncbi:MAG: hypothetical protein N2322_04910, partial [Terrimicrobiaceae bacterium]|nr:hypothetical protein [Terrimicrobiaceae bacterium]